MKHVPKDWGIEIWLVNTNLYCAKHLFIEPGYKCSLHRHKVKDETFLVMLGSCSLEVSGKVEQLCRGDERRIPPGTWHRFWNDRYAPICKILEVSTTHSDDDVERKEVSGRV